MPMNFELVISKIKMFKRYSSYYAAHRTSSTSTKCPTSDTKEDNQFWLTAQTGLYHSCQPIVSKLSFFWSSPATTRPGNIIIMASAAT